MQLSIIIINYNVKYYVELCLLSVIKACTNIDAEIIVVDNNSSDGSKEYFQNKYSQVTFIWNHVNVGFGKANNQALKISTGKYVLFLNPDTIVAENCFTNCLHFFEQNTNCGALGVRMIDGAGIFLKESKRGFPSTKIAFYKAIGLANVWPKYFGQYYATHLPELQNNQVDVLAGAFMMLSKKAIEITKGFDEDFFMYGEDIDLSYRIKKAGLDNYYLGTTTIIHFKGESTKEKNETYFNNFYGAMKLFVQKHHKGNWITHTIMNTGINIRKSIALFTNKSNAKVDAVSYNKVLIIGPTEETLQAKKALKNYSNNIFEVECLKILDFEIDKCIIENKITDLVFCVQQLSMLSIIEYIQKLKSINIAFYNMQANTIIGSNDSNQSGYCITG